MLFCTMLRNLILSHNEERVAALWITIASYLLLAVLFENCMNLGSQVLLGHKIKELTYRDDPRSSLVIE